jgi:hypothetical protein
MVILLNESHWTFQGLMSVSLVAVDSYTFEVQTSWDEDDEFSSWNVALEAYEDAKLSLEYCSQVWANAQVSALEYKLTLEVDELFMSRQLEQALVKSELTLVKSWDMNTWEGSHFDQVDLYVYGEYQIIASYTGDEQVFEIYLNSVKIDFDFWDSSDSWYPTPQEWILDWLKVNR